ncbi:TonB-dependent receptor, partial [Vibrio anguillarum]
TGYDTNVEDLIDYNYATSKYYNTDGESQLRGVEMVVGFDTGFINHQVSANFQDPKDQSGEQLVRRAKKIYKYNAAASFDDVDLSLGYQYVGERPDFSEELAAYSLFDVSVNYYVNENLTLNGRVENLTDEEYETAGGYPSPERTYYVNATYQF